MRGQGIRHAKTQLAGLARGTGTSIAVPRYMARCRGALGGIEVKLARFCIVIGPFAQSPRHQMKLPLILLSGQSRSARRV